jgi:hypothetical protein
MYAAGRVKSARARATIAAGLIKNTKGALGRSFDACFEMNDGGEVVEALKEKAKHDPQLLHAMVYEKASWCERWGNEVLAELHISRAEIGTQQVIDAQNAHGMGF